jgi:hypothetical protein
MRKNEKLKMKKGKKGEKEKNEKGKKRKFFKLAGRGDALRWPCFWRFSEVGALLATALQRVGFFHRPLGFKR